MIRRDRKDFQCIAACKRVYTNLCNRIGDGDAHQRIAGVERAVPNGGNGIGDGDARQGLAVGERAVPNGGNGIGDGDARQRIAPGERPVTNGSNLLPVKHIRNREAFFLPFVSCNHYRPIIQQRILIISRCEHFSLILRHRSRPASAHHHNDHQQRYEPFVFHRNNLLYYYYYTLFPRRVNTSAKKFPARMPSLAFSAS